jgi:hypothetical protein
VASLELSSLHLGGKPVSAELHLAHLSSSSATDRFQDSSLENWSVALIIFKEGEHCGIWDTLSTLSVGLPKVK